MAEAIATFRHDEKWLPANTTREYIGIIMRGLTPTFYKIPISLDLVEAVQNTQYPDEHQTTVQRFLPPVEDPDFLTNGMRPLDNRKMCFRCYEALRPLLVANAQL